MSVISLLSLLIRIKVFAQKHWLFVLPWLFRSGFDEVFFLLSFHVIKTLSGTLRGLRVVSAGFLACLYIYLEHAII